MHAHPIHSLLEPIKRIHAAIRDEVIAAFENTSIDDLSQVAHDSSDDVIYAVDKVSETRLIDLFGREIAAYTPIVLIGEGLPNGFVTLPTGTAPEDAIYRVIVDPIDGTRGLMYQKRSAWILTGVAPNNGDTTGVQDIELAVQTEIPVLKQHLSDILWAVRGDGAFAERYNRVTGQSSPLKLKPSGAVTIAHGFSTMSRFFPGNTVALSEIDEAMVFRLLGQVKPGKALCFEDQYISSAGQMYELMAGHDRFVADLRPLMEPLLNQRGLSLGLCCHPYDICTELIARELGVIITQPDGRALNPPLDVYTDVAWLGFANATLQASIAPVLRDVLRERDLLP